MANRLQQREFLFYFRQPLSWMQQLLFLMAESVAEDRYLCGSLLSFPRPPSLILRPLSSFHRRPSFRHPLFYPSLIPVKFNNFDTVAQLVGLKNMFPKKISCPNVFAIAANLQNIIQPSELQK